MLFLALIAFCFCLMKDEDIVIDNEMIEKINNDKDLHWTAGVNSIFVGKNFRDVKGLLGWLGNLEDSPKSEGGEFDVPDSFDTYKQWPQCKHPIRNQGQCGSCWAFSAAEAMTDRYCIAGHDVILSPQYLVSCESDEYACQGGYLSREWDYMKSHGISSDKCFPYVSGSGIVPRCTTSCKGGGALTMYKVSAYTHYGSVSEAQSAIEQHGSIQAAFEVYQDFFSYKSGVYSHKYGSLAGGHAIKIQGWGVDSGSGQKYWQVANSWGTSWGMEGYFWILRGSDECQIEDQMYGGIPAV